MQRGIPTPFRSLRGVAVTLVGLSALIAGCSLGSSSCDRKVRFVLETSPDGEVFVHDECAIGPDVETDDDCTRFEWELTGPDGEGAGNRAFVRFYVGSGLLCTQGFSGIDSDLRLYSGLPQRAWDEGPGPFATGSWNRASPTGTTAGSFSFYERSEVFP